MILYLRHYHLLEEVLLVEEDENRGLRKDWVPRHLREELERLLHSIYGVIFEKHLRQCVAYSRQMRVGTSANAGKQKAGSFWTTCCFLSKQTPPREEYV